MKANYSFNYYTFLVYNARNEVIATDQYEGRQGTIETARYYAHELHGVSFEVLSSRGRVVASERSPS